MASIDLQALADQVKSSALQAAEQVAGSALKEALADATAFAELAVPAIERWAALYFSGKLTLAELQSLFSTLGDLAAMDSLTQLGLAEIDIIHTKNSILNAAISVANIAIKAI